MTRHSHKSIVVVCLVYSLSAQKWTSVNWVKGSKHKIFIGLQYELITIAPNHYPQPIKSVVYANNRELTNTILLRWSHVWYSWLIRHNTTNTLNNTVKHTHWCVVINKDKEESIRNKAISMMRGNHRRLNY